VASILLITRDAALRAHVTQALVSERHVVTVAECGASAVAATVRVSVDLVIADSLTPELDKLRGSIGIDVPYVFLAAGASMLPGRLPTARGDQVVGKPVDARDLLAAVAAALRSLPALSAQVDLDGVTLDRPGQRLLKGDASIQLTPIEFRLMEYLVQVRGGIASNEDLLQEIWHYAPGTGSSEVVRSHLKNLRSKLRTLTASPQLIETVPRRGYRLAL
jgi:DNA-binding response OmpR family regulator